MLSLWAALSTASPLFSRSAALALTNNPLVVQLGTGALPMGAFKRTLLARTAVMEGLTAGIAAACSGASVTPESMLLLELTHNEAARCSDDAESWCKTAAEAGKSIELPQSEVEAGVRCYNCKGTHYNVDCPEDAAVSSSAVALAAYLRSAGTLGAAASVLGDVAFAARTLTKAGLDGGPAFSTLLGDNAKRLSALSDACDKALEVSGACGEPAASGDAETARSLLYALIDSEAAEAGLREDGSGSMPLAEARVALDVVEPGFLESQDKNAEFLKTEVLGATQAPERAASAAAGASRATAVDKATAYLAAKKAAGQGKDGTQMRDAQAALLAAKQGPKKAAAQQYLTLRKKQQAAAAYMAAKKQKEGSKESGDGASGES